MVSRTQKRLRWVDIPQRYRADNIFPRPPDTTGIRPGDIVGALLVGDLTHHATLVLLFVEQASPRQLTGTVIYREQLDWRVTVGMRVRIDRKHIARVLVRGGQPCASACG